MLINMFFKLLLLKIKDFMNILRGYLEATDVLINKLLLFKKPSMSILYLVRFVMSMPCFII